MSLGSQNMTQSSASTGFFSVIWYLLTILTKKSNIFKIPMLAPFDRKNHTKYGKIVKKDANYGKLAFSMQRQQLNIIVSDGIDLEGTAN